MAAKSSKNSRKIQQDVSIIKMDWPPPPPPVGLWDLWGSPAITLQLPGFTVLSVVLKAFCASDLAGCEIFKKQAWYTE